jgi:hypothetical protein
LDSLVIFDTSVQHEVSGFGFNGWLTYRYSRRNCGVEDEAGALQDGITKPALLLSPSFVWSDANTGTMTSLAESG